MDAMEYVFIAVFLGVFVMMVIANRRRGSGKKHNRDSGDGSIGVSGGYHSHRDGDGRSGDDSSSDSGGDSGGGGDGGGGGD